MQSVHTATDDQRTFQVWNWCVDSYAKVGQILRFPGNTSPQKTYQWRYAKKLAQKLEEWDFDDNTCQVFIDHVAAYSREKNLLHKGLAAFFQTNILEICYNRLERSYQKSESTVDLLARTKSLLDERSVKGSILKGLLDRPAPDALFNLITWYELGEIPKLYMALSKSCTQALAQIAKLDPDQRSMLPNKSELFITAKNFVSNRASKRQAKVALGIDWRELCL